MNFKSLFFFLVLVVAAYGVCELPVSVGPCRGYFERWAYSEGTCELFGYSGCDGNDNNFDTKEICELTCINKTNEPDVCELPKSVGHCRANLERWFYSGGVCQIFRYSGCGGNGNNFNTKESCELTCLNRTNGPEAKEVMLDEEGNGGEGKY